MNFRESIDNPDHGEPYYWEIDPVEGLRYASGYVQGYAEVTGRRLVTSSNGHTMRIHDLDNDTRSAPIARGELKTTPAVRIAVQAQLDALPYWGPEGDGWGPDPWRDANKNRTGHE